MTDQLKENFKTFEAQLTGKGIGFRHDVREAALSTFHGLPGLKDEEYRYTQIGRILDKKFQFDHLSSFGKKYKSGKHVLFQDADAYHIYIHNGIVDQEGINNLSAKGLTVISLQDASEKYSEDTDAHFGKYAGKNNDAFAAINTIFSFEGVFIKVEKNTRIDKPVLLHYSGSDHADQSIIQTRNLIIAEQGCEVDLIESYTSDHKEEHFSNHVSEIVVKGNSKVNYHKLQNQSPTAYHVDNTFIAQGRDSVVKSYVFTLEGKIIRNNLNFSLNEENCEAHMFGLYVAHGNNHIDNHTVADHKVANCYSNEIYKGILDDQSKAVFNGKIYVRPDAQKTNAFQSNKNILLTDTASVNTKPQLEIWADDVSCSHGCTTGQIDEEQLFYLRSRGIGKDSARAMLLHAFVDDVLDKIKIEFLHNYVSAEMNNRLD